MRGLDLNRLLAGAGRGFLIAVAAWTGGCLPEDSTPSRDMPLEQPDLGPSMPPIERFDSFDSPLCIPSPTQFNPTKKALSIGGLAPAGVVDSLEYRNVFTGNYGGTWTTESVETLGVVCATATDRAKCQSDVAALKPTTGFGCVNDIAGARLCSYLVTTAGDRVEVLGDLVSVKQFLGAIDTPQEALLLVRADREPAWPSFEISCNNKASGAVHAVEDGYQVVAYTSQIFQFYDHIYYQHLLHVTHAGDISIIQTKKVPKESYSIFF